MQGLSDEGRRVVADIAGRHGLSQEAVEHLLFAVAAGQGSQAQFNHPELGGMGQWSQGGMIMVGDMFNQGLKARVDAVCSDIAGSLRNATLFDRPPMVAAQMQSQSSGGGGVSLFVPGGVAGSAWWPPELGQPSSVGSQNDLHYAVFPGTRRLAILRGGGVTVYDTVDHNISGFSQQQSGDQSVTFTSQYGLVRVADLAVVGPAATHREAPSAEPKAPETKPGDKPAAPGPAAVAPSQPATTDSQEPTAPAVQASSEAAPVEDADAIFAKLERLAALHEKGILTEAEFAAKKAELLDRL